MIVVAGCDSKKDAEAAATTPAAAPASSAPAADPSPSASEAAGNDAATVKACADLKKDIKDNASKVAKAKKIGPPAGHFAVSAQWSAASASVIAHSIGTSDTVSAAADKVQNEMNALGEAYNKSANAKPSEAKLNAAIKELDTACAA
jgi:hypothetical protein